MAILSTGHFLIDFLFPFLKVLIEQKYMAKTCGLCGNFDGQELNEFLSEGMIIIIY